VLRASHANERFPTEHASHEPPLAPLSFADAKAAKKQKVKKEKKDKAVEAAAKPAAAAKAAKTDTAEKPAPKKAAEKPAAAASQAPGDTDTPMGEAPVDGAPAEGDKKFFSDKHTVFVSSLSFDVIEEDLREVFAVCGSLKEVRVQRETQRKRERTWWAQQPSCRPAPNQSRAIRKQLGIGRGGFTRWITTAAHGGERLEQKRRTPASQNSVALDPGCLMKRLPDEALA
jgi:hypothetical protein